MHRHKPPRRIRVKRGYSVCGAANQLTDGRSRAKAVVHPIDRREADAPRPEVLGSCLVLQRTDDSLARGYRVRKWKTGGFK